MGRIIKAKVLRTKKTIAIARWLLGKHLVRRRSDGQIDARMITEIEAYNGERDLACHARAGRTGRTEVLYGEGGVWYVYLCYGIHEMLNLVVGPADAPAALLIRSVEGARGPGRLTKVLGIDRALNAVPAIPASGLWLEDRGVRVPRRLVQATARIGVDYAGPVWAGKRWRFTFDPAVLNPVARTSSSLKGRPKNAGRVAGPTAVAPIAAKRPRQRFRAP